MLNNMTRLRSQRGLSLVELMVGITVGLIVTAAASMVAVNQINEHRRLMLETQIQQDLRTAADLIQQDMRRAGFRGMTGLGVWAPASGVGSSQQVPEMDPNANTYSAVTVGEDKRTFSYSYSLMRDGKNTAAPLSNEYFGVLFRPNTETLYLQVGTVNGQPNWQPITDPETVKITDFQVNLTTQVVSLGDYCDRVCTGAGCAAPPQQEVRRVTITLQGRAARDDRVVRTLTATERLRADNFTGSCPSW
jgi:prepilin-type N-terminal cleavage/methylation domain-containing protein